MYPFSLILSALKLVKVSDLKVIITWTFSLNTYKLAKAPGSSVKDAPRARAAADQPEAGGGPHRPRLLPQC